MSLQRKLVSLLLLSYTQGIGSLCFKPEFTFLSHHLKTQSLQKSNKLWLKVIVLIWGVFNVSMRKRKVCVSSRTRAVCAPSVSVSRGRAAVWFLRRLLSVKMQVGSSLRHFLTLWGMETLIFGCFRRRLLIHISWNLASSVAGRIYSCPVSFSFNLTPQPEPVQRDTPKNMLTWN